MTEQATCPHGRKIDDRPTALKNMTKCHCCGMKIAPAYRTLCAQCEDAKTMTDTKITITPEEAAALYAQFNADSDVFLQGCMDRDEQMPPHYDRVMIHALTLAVARERERCAGIAEDDHRFAGNCFPGEEIAKKIRGEK